MLYLNSGLSFGNLSGGQFGVNYFSGRKFSLQMEYSATARKAKNTPDDYSGGLFSLFAFNANAPKDMARSFRIMPGIVSKGKPGGKLRMNYKAGVSLLTLKEPVNYVSDPMGGFLLAPNYTWDYQTKNQVGVVLKTDFEIIAGKFVGMSISPCLEIAHITSFAVAINLLVGKVEESDE